MTEAATPVMPGPPPTDTETEAVRKPLVVTEFGFTPAPEPT